MPGKTEKQRKAAAVALHSPEKLYKRNKGLLSMAKSKLRHFAMKEKARSEAVNKIKSKAK